MGRLPHGRLQRWAADGGAFTHYLGWRVIFWFVALVMLVAASGFLGTKSSDEPAKANLSGVFDWAGCLLLVGVMTSSVLTLHGLGNARKAPLAFVAPLMANSATLVLFVLAERRAREPFVDLNHVYFENRSFSSSGSRRSLVQRRSATTKGSWFRRASKSATRRVRSSAQAWQW